MQDKPVQIRLKNMETGDAVAHSFNSIQEALVFLTEKAEEAKNEEA